MLRTKDDPLELLRTLTTADWHVVRRIREFVRAGTRSGRSPHLSHALRIDTCRSPAERAPLLGHSGGDIIEQSTWEKSRIM